MSFNCNADVIEFCDVPQPLARARAGRLHKARLLAAFSEVFSVVDATSEVSEAWPWKLESKHYGDCRTLLRRIRAEAGIIHLCQYGYKMTGAIIPSLIEKFFPAAKEQIRVAFGPSSVEWYYLAANTYIVNKDGQLVWQFAGKIAATPELDLTVEGFMRSFAGLDPAQQTLVSAMAKLSHHYVDFTGWQVAETLRGSSNVNYYARYPEQKRDKHIALFPASLHDRVPFLRKQ